VTGWEWALAAALALGVWLTIAAVLGRLAGRVIAYGTHKPPAGESGVSPRPREDASASPPAGVSPAHPHDMPPGAAGAPATIRAAAGTRRVIELWYIAECGCGYVVDIRAKTTESHPCREHAFDVDAWNQRLAQS
jgi:hypothetical protein